MKALRSCFIHPLPPLAGLLSFEVGSLFVLIGWAIVSTDLKSLTSGLIPMMPNDGLAVIFTGLSLVCAAFGPEVRGLRRMAGGSAAIVAGIGLVSLLEYLLGMNSRVNQWSFVEPLETVGPWIPGRMGLDTAICFLLLGVMAVVTAVRRAAIC